VRVWTRLSGLRVLRQGSNLIHPERPFSHVVLEIGRDSRRLLHDEWMLGKAELHVEWTRARRSVLLWGAAGVAGLFAILFLLLAIQPALTRVVPDWASALIIAGSLVLCCAAGVRAGSRRFKQIGQLMPKTLQHLS